MIKLTCITGLLIGLVLSAGDQTDDALPGTVIFFGNGMFNPTKEAIDEVGLFGNQNSVCQPTTPKWHSQVLARFTKNANK